MILELLLSLAIAAPPDTAAPEVPPEITDVEARAHFTAGMIAWNADDYATAQRELEAAFAEQPVPMLLYALGQLLRLQGDCEQARERFLAFIATNPPEREAVQARLNAERCQPAKTSTPAPTPPPVVVDVPPPSKPPAQRASKRPDALGLGLTVGGTVIAATGAVLLGSAFARQHRAEQENDVEMFERGVRGATAQYWSGVALLGAGGAVLVGGIVRLAIASRRARAPRRTARVRSR